MLYSRDNLMGRIIDSSSPLGHAHLTWVGRPVLAVCASRRFGQPLVHRPTRLSGTTRMLGFVPSPAVRQDNGYARGQAGPAVDNVWICQKGHVPRPRGYRGIAQLYRRATSRGILFFYKGPRSGRVWSVRLGDPVGPRVISGTRVSCVLHRIPRPSPNSPTLPIE